MDTALSLVGYDAELEAAMAFVFGTSFVCVNMEVAKKVTFHSSISRKSVTINGDSFDPAGLASGGSSALFCNFKCFTNGVSYDHCYQK